MLHRFYSSCLELRTKDYFNIHWNLLGGLKHFKRSLSMLLFMTLSAINDVSFCVYSTPILISADPPCLNDWQP